MPSLRSQVIDAVQTTLEGVTQANGYSVDLSVLRRMPGTADGQSVQGSLPAVVLLEQGETHERDATERIRHVLTLELVLLTVHDPDDPDHQDAQIDAVQTDIHKAMLLADRFGLAYVLDAEITASEKQSESAEEALLETILTLEVTYFTDHDDLGAYSGAV